MKDVELLVRYFAFHNNFAEYRGPMRTFLDSSCDALNRDFQGKAQQLEHQLQHFERAVELGYEVFGDQFGHGWDVNKGTWSKKKNMAVLDVVVHYLSLLVKRGSEGNAGEVKVAVERLLRDEGAFQESIRQTARHGRESPARFRLLGRELVDSGVNVPVTGGA